MYRKVTCRVKTKKGFTDKFPISVGTQQGCNLSPSLFNCYMNDLPNVLERVDGNQPFLLDTKIFVFYMQTI